MDADRYNANIVCNAGMGLGALAIAGDSTRRLTTSAPPCCVMLRFDPARPGDVRRRRVVAGRPNLLGIGDALCVRVFRRAADGAWETIMGLAPRMASIAPGASASIRRAPRARFFDFGDAVEDAGLAPEMFWLAKRFANPVFAWSEQKLLERSPHADAYDLAWFDRDAKSPQQPPPWALGCYFPRSRHRLLPQRVGRSQCALSGGEGWRQQGRHAHLDLGSFVLDAGGVRWASDLGWTITICPATLTRQRWTLLPDAHRSAQHSADRRSESGSARRGAHHAAGVRARFQLGADRFITRQSRQSETVAAAFCDGPAAGCPDSGYRALRSAGRVIWGMMTDAEITVTGQTALLRRNGWNLAAEIRTPRHAVFDVAPVRSFSTPGGESEFPQAGGEVGR